MIKDKKIKNYELTLDTGLIVVGSDIHFPYQDDKAVNAFIDFCTEHQPEVIVINGDVLDFYKLSRFSKDPAGKNPKEEIEMCRDFFKTLKASCSKSQIYYTIGNHETRLEKYVLDYAPQVACLMDNVFQIIKTDELGIIGCASLLINNSIIFKHGNRLGSKSGLSAIKELEAHYLSGATGHTHRLAKFSTRKSGRRFFWFETGCLCTLDPEYMIDPDWEQGFVTIYIQDHKVISSHIHEIVDGAIR